MRAADEVASNARSIIGAKSHMNCMIKCLSPRSSFLRMGKPLRVGCRVLSVYFLWFDGSDMGIKGMFFLGTLLFLCDICRCFSTPPFLERFGPCSSVVAVGGSAWCSQATSLSCLRIKYSMISIHSIRGYSDSWLCAWPRSDLPWTNCGCCGSLMQVRGIRSRRPWNHQPR